MSVRLYIVGTELTRHANPSGGQSYFMVGGEKAYFLVDAGTPYIFTTIEGLVHPSLKKHIGKVTLQRRIDDVDHIAIIETGVYEHGAYRAEVTRTYDNQGRPTMWINAEAPTVAMLKRFIRPLLAGVDKPTHAYSKKAAQPSVPAN